MSNSKKNGYLILGAYDNGTLSGLKVDDDLLKQISAEIMERLGLKHRYNVKHRYIYPLIEGGCGVMTIPEKPNSRDQKYKRALT